MSEIVKDLERFDKYIGGLRKHYEDATNKLVLKKFGIKGIKIKFVKPKFLKPSHIVYDEASKLSKEAKK